MRDAIEGVLEALEREHVEYIIVGGVAVVVHGYLRTTADLDLVVRLQKDNVLRAVAALTRLGLRARLPVPPEQFADADRRREWIETKGLMVFSFWSPDAPGFAVDLFAEEPFDFERVHARALRVPLEHTTAVVIPLADLIRMKREAGRARDRDDVLHLESIERLATRDEPED